MEEAKEAIQNLEKEIKNTITKQNGPQRITRCPLYRPVATAFTTPPVAEAAVTGAAFDSVVEAVGAAVKRRTNQMQPPT